MKTDGRRGDLAEHRTRCVHHARSVLHRAASRSLAGSDALASEVLARSRRRAADDFASDGPWILYSGRNRADEPIGPRLRGHDWTRPRVFVSRAAARVDLLQPA